MSRFDTTPTAAQIHDATFLLLRYPDRLHRLAGVAVELRQWIDQITEAHNRRTADIVAWLRALNRAELEVRNQ
jgi:hypothetical protein